jgi:hypothetical protein
MADRSVCALDVEKSEYLCITVEDLNDRDTARSFAITLSGCHRWAEGQVRAVSVVPVRGFFGGETREGFELICETAVHVDRLFGIHEAHWHIAVWPEQRLLIEPYVQRLGRRGDFGDNPGYLVDGREGGEVRSEGDVRGPFPRTNRGTNLHWVEKCNNGVALHKSTLWQARRPRKRNL